MGSERQRQDTDISSDICIQSGWTRIHGVQESIESGVVLLPFSLSSLLQVTRFPFCGRRRFSLTIHLLLTLILFIEKSGWLANFFKRNAKFNWFRTTLWCRFDTELREGNSRKHASKEHRDTITKWSRSSGGRKEPHAQQPSQALFRPTGEPCHQFTASDVSLACSIQGNRCELYRPVT